MSSCPICGGTLAKKKKAKIVVGYTCLICKKYHTNYQDALDCESSHNVQDTNNKGDLE